MIGDVKPSVGLTLGETKACNVRKGISLSLRMLSFFNWFFFFGPALLRASSFQPCEIGVEQVVALQRATHFPVHSIAIRDVGVA